MKQYITNKLMPGFIILVLSLSFFMLPLTSFAYEFNDKFSVVDFMVGGFGWLDVDDDITKANRTKFTIAGQPKFLYQPFDDTVFGVKIGFACNNAINDKSPFKTVVWGEDLRDQIKDMNGRSRDYLMLAYGTQTFHLGSENELSITAGIIDSTDYIDINDHAGNPSAQFHNLVFVSVFNGSVYHSFDYGGVVDWSYKNFDLNFVFMTNGGNNDGNAYQFYASQAAYKFSDFIGDGDIKLTVSTTSSDFLDNRGKNKESVKTITCNFDHDFGKHYATFFRIAHQAKDAAVTWSNQYSGGFNIAGSLWGRDQDNIGIATAYLNDGNLDVDNSQVYETYLRVGIIDHLHVTFDIQYLKDEYKHVADVKGFYGNIRLDWQF